MRWLVWYIRSIFCNHDFQYDEKMVHSEFSEGIKVSALCKKCSYHRKFWKYCS